MTKTRAQQASAKAANADDEAGEGPSAPRGKQVPPADEGDESSEHSADVAAAASPKKSAAKSQAALRQSPRKSKPQDVGPRPPRGKRGPPDDEGHGGSDTAADLILPYARSFTFFQRFDGLETVTSKHHVKFPRARDSDVRSRDLISDKKPFDWLISMQSQPSGSADYSKGPGHDAASGLIGCHSSTLSQTSFISTRACEDRDRSDGDFKHWGDQKTQDVQWMMRPISTLAKNILAMSRRPSTRATAADVASGNDIFIGSSHLGLLEFVSFAQDDIELIDFLSSMGETARVWHSSKLIKDGMMWRSITSVLVNESGSSGEALQFLTDHESDVEFLGIVSVHTKPNVDRTITAFNIHSMMLLRYDKKGSFTEIGCIITSRDLLSSSMQERLVQICQVLQSCRYGRAEVKIKIPLSSKRIDTETKASLISAGFTFPTMENCICSGSSILLMAKYTYGLAWMKYYDIIRLDDESPPTYGNAGFMDAVLNDIFKDLLDYECNFAPGSGLKYQSSLLTKMSEIHDWTPETQLTDDLVRQAASVLITHASRATHFPLCVIIHAVAARLKSGKKPCGIMEVSSELLQYIDIAIYAPKSTSTAFRGDRHKCRLYCRRCDGYLTDEAFRLYDLMSNAAISIASHYNVFPHISDDPSDTELEDKFWTCPPLFSSIKELGHANERNKFLKDNDRTAPVESNLCRYGQSKSGDRKFDRHWTGEQRDINNSNLMSFTEAVLIDANPGHEECTEINRRFLTRSLLSCLFERMSLVFQFLEEKDKVDGYDSDDNNEIASNFAGYATAKCPDPDSAIKDAEGYAKLAASLRIFAGLAAVIDHTFCLNLSVLSDKIVGANFHPALGTKLKEFFDCIDSQVCDVTAGALELSVSGVRVPLFLRNILDERPIAEQRKKEDKIPLSGIGDGWDCAEAEGWFNDNPAEKKQRASSAQESSENLILMRSITHIKYTRTQSGERKYFFKCDFTGAINRDPQIPIKHKRLLAQTQFDCSAELVMSFPFAVVKGWSQNRWHDLSSRMKPLRQHIARTEKSAIKSIQLWRKDGWGKLLFRVVQEIEIEGGVNTEVVYVKGDRMKRDFGHEKWIFNAVAHLSSVRSGCIVNVGEGATDSHRPHARGDLQSYAQPNVDNAPDTWQSSNNRASEGKLRNNIWWSRENELKQCVQGCITNLLDQMNGGAEAMRFKRLSTLDDASLMKELNINRLPKNVVINGQIDDFEKCKWLLCAHFKCNHTRPLNITQFRSLSLMVDNLSQIKFPVVLSMKITNARYNHVIIVWRKTIIDFEQPTTYPLTVNNLDFSCGPASQFLTVDRGYGILPSRDMKKACNIADWGESDVDDELKNLFLGGRKKKKRKRGKK